MYPTSQPLSFPYSGFLTSMPCSCWFLLSESPPSPLLFPFSSSLLSKPYLSIWFSVTPSPPLYSLHSPHFKAMPSNQALIPPVGSLGDISCLVAEIHLDWLTVQKPGVLSFSVNKFTWEGVKNAGCRTIIPGVWFHKSK